MSQPDECTGDYDCPVPTCDYDDCAVTRNSEVPEDQSPEEPATLEEPKEPRTRQVPIVVQGVLHGYREEEISE